MEGKQVEPAAERLMKCMESKPSPIVVALLRRGGYTDEQIAARVAQLETKSAQKEVEEAQKLAELAKVYNLDVERDKESLRKLLGMQEELSYCQQCDGISCPKRHYKFDVPTPEWAWGELYLRRGPCLVEKNRRADERLPAEFRGMTFEDFDTSLKLHDTLQDAQAAAQALNLAKKVVTDGATNLYLYGTFGSGKTLLASLIAKTAMCKNRSVEFGTVAKLLGELKETFDDPTRKTGDVLNRFCYCDVLILDDVGAEQPTAWKIEQLFELVNARYADHKQLVITSNYTPDELHAELKKVNRVKAGQLMSRINAICEFGYTGETDIRFKIKKGAI